MPLLARIYFNAVFGGLGGLLGWLLYGAFAEPLAGESTQWLLGGAVIGGSIGYLVVSVDAIRDRSPVRFCRLASHGLILGAVGGALGLWIGDWVNFVLGRHFGTSLVGAMTARALGWTVLGLAIGLSEGVAARSLQKLTYGTLGGTLGGFTGGAFFGLIYMATLARAGDSQTLGALGGALGLIILGACIGALSALVEGVFQPASVRVLRGWQEGREYAILRPETLLGRDEHADVALFRDMKVQKRHAVISRLGERFRLVNANAPPDQTLVNDRPVHTEQDLQDGDRIQLGNIVLRFQRRAAVVRPRKR